MVKDLKKELEILSKRISKWCYGKEHCRNDRCSELNVSDSYMRPKLKIKLKAKLMLSIIITDINIKVQNVVFIH